MMDARRAAAKRLIYQLGHRDTNWNCCIGDEQAVQIIMNALADAEALTKEHEKEVS